MDGSVKIVGWKDGRYVITGAEVLDGVDGSRYLILYLNVHPVDRSDPPMRLVVPF